MIATYNGNPVPEMPEHLTNALLVGKVEKLMYDWIFQEAVKIESTWWALVEIPQQNRAENFSSYVLRVCNTIDSVRIPLNSEANPFRESEREKDARVEKVNGKNNYYWPRVV